MVLMYGKETSPPSTLLKFRLLSLEISLFYPISCATVFLNAMWGFASEMGLSAVSELNSDIGRPDTHHNKHRPGCNPTNRRCCVCSVRGMTWMVMFKCVKCDMVLCVDWNVLWITTQKTTHKTFFHLFSVQTVKALTSMQVKEHGYLQVAFGNLFSPLCNKDITAFLRHSKQCLLPSPQNAFCFTNLSHLVLEIIKFFEKHAQNLNTPQNNLASCNLQMGFKLVFKGLMNLLRDFSRVSCYWW